MMSQKRISGLQTNVLYKQNKQPRRKKPRKVLLITGLCLIVFGIALGAFGYPALAGRYRLDNAQARIGGQELEEGIGLLRKLPSNPFDTKVVSQAQRDFGDALAIFSRLSGDINRVPDVFTLLPAWGLRLSAAKHLLPLALDAAQAGLAGCNVISTLALRLHNPLNKNAGLTTADMAELGRELQIIKLTLDEAIGQLNYVQPGDLQLDPGLGKMLGEFRAYLPLIQQGVAQATSLVSVLPALLGIGTPTNYLIEILDSTELRPGGGFVGNYGIATLTGGQVTSVRVTDTYLLDNAYDRTHFIPRPYGWFTLSYKPGWGLRDSNLDADFPTSARNGEMLYNLEGGTVPLTGVIAITPALIEQILTLTGPISIPEYHEKVTAQNLVDRIHYYQLIEASRGGDVSSADGNSSVRKHFTALLGQYMLARVRTLPVSFLPKLFGVLINSLHTKDVQIYFNAVQAEKVLQFYHVDDSIETPPGDGIFVVDANVAQDKANAFLVTTVNDQVIINQVGTAYHRTIINFTWTKPGLTSNDFYGSTQYKAYIRVYVPAGSVLYTQSGWKGPFDRGISSGRRFWGGYFSLNYPLAGSITLNWSVAGAAHEDGHGWHYLYLMQRQAGSQQKMSLQVALPPCASIIHASAGIVADSKRQAHLAQALNQDTAVSINYTCSG